MGKKLRIEYPGAVYHVMSRGNGRQNIFLDNRDKEFFLSLFSRAFKKYGLIVHAYVLMDNHYHLLIETPEGNLSTIMRWLNVTYSSYFSWRHKCQGHLFQGRYKDKLVEKNNYMVQASLYIHLNPLKAGMETRLGDYPYSSLRDYTRTHKNKDITLSTVLGMLSDNREEAIKKYRKLIRSEKNNVKSDDTFDEVILGSKEFIKKIMSSLKENRLTDNATFRKLARAQLSSEAIIDLVCAALSTKTENIHKNDTANRNTKSISIYMIKNYTPLTNKQIGEIFGISYSGVTQCCFRLEKKASEDKEFSKTIQSIQQTIESQLW